MYDCYLENDHLFNLLINIYILLDFFLHPHSQRGEAVRVAARARAERLQQRQALEHAAHEPQQLRQRRPGRGGVGRGAAREAPQGGEERLHGGVERALGHAARAQQGGGERVGELGGVES